jgi:hypothetical protein
MLIWSINIRILNQKNTVTFGGGWLLFLFLPKDSPFLCFVWVVKLPKPTKWCQQAVDKVSAIFWQLMI